MNSYEKAGNLAVELGKTASALKKEGYSEMAENYEKLSMAILRTMLKKSKDYASGVTGKELATAYKNDFDDNIAVMSRLSESRNKNLDKVMKNRLKYCRGILG